MSLNWLQRFYFEIIIAILIISLPFSLYVHVFFKDTSNVLHFFGLTFYHEFPGNDVFVWFVLKKLIAILILTIWFITSKFWWRYFILSPIIPYSYQIWDAFFNPSKILDVFSHFKSLPFLLIIIITLFALSYYVSVKYKILDIYDKLTIEIEELLSRFKNQDVSIISFENKFRELKNNLATKKDEESLAQLVGLQKDLNYKLKK